MARYPRVVVAVISLVVACFGPKLWANVNGTDVRANRTLFVDGAAPLVVPWSAPFADTNYTAVCTAEMSEGSFLPVITSRSAGSMTIVPANNPNLAGILDCIAVPDSDQSDRRHGRTIFSGNPATVTVTWNSPFPDTNYIAVCTVETADPNNVSFDSLITNVAPGSVTVTNGGINAGTMHCLAVPTTDPGVPINYGSALVADNPPIVVVNWNAVFPEPAYAAVCSDLANSGATAPYTISGSKTVTQITVVPLLDFGSVDCLGGSGSTFATSLSLSISTSSPSAGQVVTLTATATSESEAKPTGTVVFLNGSHVLGTAQLEDQSIAFATLKIRFGPGAYTLTALYTGNNPPQAPIFAPSQSVPQVISVSGAEPTQSTLTATPNGGNYNLGLSVFGFGFPSLVGTGAVLNLTQQNQLVADINVGPGITGLLPPQTASLGLAHPGQMTVADFNLDGFPDIAITDNSTNRVLVLLGNGDGTFQNPLITTVGNAPFGIAAGDFNDDGFPDLAVANAQDGTITILQGNGDGTFTLIASFPVASGATPNALTIGDFNSDGQLDLAVTDTSNNAVDVFFGLGNGQFSPGETPPLSVGTFPDGVVAADFNFDAFSDLAVVNKGSNTVSILLGNGDGTFQTALTVPTGSRPSSVAVADFNGDGIADLAISNQGSASVSILLGDGSGNFTLHSSPAVGNGPIAVQVADLNGDGIADLVVANQADQTVGVLLGNGNGTFQPQHTTSITAMPLALALADFNGDSVPDPVTGNFTNGGTASVFLAGTVSTGTANNVPVHGHGNQQLQANFAPVESVFAPSTSNTVTVMGTGLPSVTSLTSSLNPSVYLQTVTFTATVTGSQGPPTGTVNFTADGVLICSGVQLVQTQNQSTATCSINTLATGNHIVLASYSGNDTYMPSQSSPLLQVVTVAATSTVITANPPSPSVFGQLVTFTATVTGANGGSPSGVVSFDENDNGNSHGLAGCSQVVLVPQQIGSIATCQTTVLAVGAHQISSYYAGDSNFSGSFSGFIPYQVNPAASSVSLLVSPPNAVAGQVVTLTAAVSGPNGPLTSGTVTFLNQVGAGQVLGTVQLLGSAGTATLRTRFAPGTFNLVAFFNGTNSYAPSSSSPQPLSVTGTEPTVSTLTATPNGQDYDFGLSVFAFAFPPLVGSATVNNLTQNSALLGNIDVAGPGTPTFLPQQTFATGAQPTAIATGDFNNDGILDLVAVNSTDNTLSILLGNGEGTFQAQTIVSVPPEVSHNGIVTADFNGDGNLDLAVLSYSEGDVVTVLFGDGHGNFPSQQSQAFYRFTISVLATGDFNGDGYPDVVAGGSGYVVVALNDGNGRLLFSEAVYPAAQAPTAIVTGDFNRDGILDVAITDSADNDVVVLLGNGDGSFQSPLTFTVGQAPSAIAAGILTMGGPLDLVVANSGDNTVSVLLGDGHGSFQPQQVFPVGSTPDGVAIADFNGDGILDLAIVNSGDNTAGILTGNGDGTFQTQQPYSTGLQPVSLVAADLNGDGVPDLAVANGNANNASVLLGGTASSGTVTNVPVTGNGIQNVQSNFTPTSSFLRASLSNIVQVNGSSRLPTVTTVSSSLNPSTYLQAVTFTASVTGNTRIAPTGTMTFTDAGNVICSAVPLTQGQTSSTAVCRTASLAVGSHAQIVATYSGDASFLSSSGTLTPSQVVNPVGDFTVLPITPGSVTVTQGFSNLTQPFFAQPINVTVQPLSGYANTVSLTCSATPSLSSGSCTVNPPNSGSLANGNLVTTITLSTGSATPMGSYTVTVKAQDNNGLSHSARINLTVIQNGSGVSMASGGAGTTTVSFSGPPNTPVSNFSCPSVMGSGITGSEPFSDIGGVCTFTPASVNLPNPVTVTISGCTVARLQRHVPIYACFFFGMPAAVLLGSARRKGILWALALLLCLTALLLGIGCGGGYGPLTPTGHYYVLVQGTDTSGTTYSAVVPLTVNPLAQ